MPDLRWKGLDRKVIGPWGPVMVKPGGEFRPLKRVVGRRARRGMVILKLECGHEVQRVGSPVKRARCEFCFEEEKQHVPHR